MSGDVERGVRASLALLKDEATPALYDALSAGAIVLAKALDAGAGLSTAAIQRELRTTLLALVPTEEVPDDKLVTLMQRIEDATRKARST